MGIVRAVCTSLAKGTQKTNVKSAEFIEDFGIKEDAMRESGIVRSVFFPMKRLRRFGQEEQRLQMVHLEKIWW